MFFTIWRIFFVENSKSQRGGSQYLRGKGKKTIFLLIFSHLFYCTFFVALMETSFRHWIKNLKRYLRLFISKFWLFSHNCEFPSRNNFSKLWVKKLWVGQKHPEHSGSLCWWRKSPGLSRSASTLRQSPWASRVPGPGWAIQWISTSAGQTSG